MREKRKISQFPGEAKPVKKVYPPWEVTRDMYAKKTIRRKTMLKCNVKR